MEGQKNFCFLKGELVDCIPGRVQDCNVKRVCVCALEEQEKVENETNSTNGFCFCKGELVTCSNGTIQDCNIKRVNKCPKD